MGVCYVPLCNVRTDRGKNIDAKGRKISMHEFPSNMERREVWIRAIRRRGETSSEYHKPMDTSRVCSLHFRKEDFVPNIKYRRLKAEAVPSVFPNYPANLQPENKIPRKESSRWTDDDEESLDNLPSCSAQPEPMNLTMLEDASCFVPFCDSKRLQRKRSGKNAISFYDFPCDLTLRENWIKAIARKDPETNEYSVPNKNNFVCSLHFTPDQFRKLPYGRKQLKFGSIPNIFPNYPECLPQSSSTVKQFDLVSSQVLGSSNIKDFRKVEGEILSSEEISSENDERNDILDATVKSSELSNVLCTVLTSNTDGNVKKIQTDPPNLGSITDLDLFEESQSEECYENSLIHPLENVTETDTVLSPTENISSMKENLVASIIQKNASRQKAAAERKRWKNYIKESHKVCKKRMAAVTMKARRYKDEVLKLEEEIFNIRSMYEIMNEKFKLYNIVALEKSIENKDPNALFLYDQLQSLTKKTFLWSESTMEFANSFEETFPAAYNFVQQTEVINLPSPKILNYDLGEIDDSDASM